MYVLQIQKEEEPLLDLKNSTRRRPENIHTVHICRWSYTLTLGTVQ